MASRISQQMSIVSSAPLVDVLKSHQEDCVDSFLHVLTVASVRHISVS